MKSYNPIEKWAPVLESDIGEQIPSTGIAIIVATSLELQTIEHTNKSFPEEILRFASYFRPIIRRTYGTIARFNERAKEADLYIGHLVAKLDGEQIKRDVLKYNIQQIHSGETDVMNNVGVFNLSAAIKEYEPYATSVGDSINNIILNDLSSFIVITMKEICDRNIIIPIWYLKAEINDIGEWQVSIISDQH